MDSVINKTQYQKARKTTKLQKKKKYELNKRRASNRKHNESNKDMKQNERKQKRVNLVEEDFDLGRFFPLATTDKFYVNTFNLHEIKSEFLLDCKGDFEMIGPMLIDELEQKTNIRFKNVDDFETYINAIDNEGYDSDDFLFTGWLYKLNALEFNKIN